MTWAATLAKAKFSEVLDKAEIEGPQLINRRRREFFVITREDLAELKTQNAAEKPFVSGWDALAPSSGAKFDLKLPARKGPLRAAKF